MAFLSTYSPRNVLVNYAAAILDSGRSDDVWITISQNAPRASFRKGNSGDTSAALSADHSVTVTLSFYPESQSAKALTGIYNGLKAAERSGNPVLGAYPLVISDPSGATLLLAKEAVLMNSGDISLGSDTGTVDFEFFVEDALQLPLEGDLAEEVNSSLDELGIQL